MKRIAIIMFAVLALVASNASAKPVTATLDGTITSGQGWCCGTSVGFAGTGSVSGLGKVSFTGGYASGSTPGGLEPWWRLKVVNLKLTTNQGDISLGGRIDWLPSAEEPPLIGTITEATGKYVGYSGEGNFTVAVQGQAVTVTMTGSFNK